jgi:iron complex transport system substrate-binding protein
MGRPGYAFRTSQFTAYADDERGAYRLEPGSHRIALSVDRQVVPETIHSPELERAVTAWVIARGGRLLNLNGRERVVAPCDLDRSAQAAVRRLVSIAPSNAEIVGALGATALLVGCESSSDLPSAVLSLPRLGPDLAVDMEALAALQPDLVLASLTVPGMERNVTALERLGVPYLVLAPQSLADILSDIRRVGAAIGFADSAAQLVKNLEARLAELLAESAAGPPARVYLEWWPKPMFTPARACWSNELIRLAGGVNVFEDLAGQSAEIGAEQVASAGPDVIFVAWCGVPFGKLNVERVMRREGLEQVRAVRERRVYPIDESLLGRPGPRVIEGIEAMARAIRGA